MRAMELWTCVGWVKISETSKELSLLLSCHLSKKYSFWTKVTNVTFYVKSKTVGIQRNACHFGYLNFSDQKRLIF